MQRQQKNAISSGILGLAGLWVALLAACTGVTEPRRNVPVEGDSVVVRPVGSTPVEPMDSVVKCDLVWVLGSRCWMVRDSVRP